MVVAESDDAVDKSDDAADGSDATKELLPAETLLNALKNSHTRWWHRYGHRWWRHRDAAASYDRNWQVRCNKQKKISFFTIKGPLTYLHCRNRPSSSRGRRAAGSGHTATGIGRRWVRSPDRGSCGFPLPGTAPSARPWVMWWRQFPS